MDKKLTDVTDNKVGKITDSEIVKAKELIKKLEEAYHSYYDTTKSMPYDIDATLRETAICLENSLNEINRLQAKVDDKEDTIQYADKVIKQLEKCKDTLICEKLKLLQQIESLQAENERLKIENKLLINNDVGNKYPNCVLVEKGRIYTRTLEDYDRLIGDISAEAYKEFAERLKENSIATFSWEGVVMVEEIDILLKELGDKNVD